MGVVTVGARPHTGDMSQTQTPTEMSNPVHNHNGFVISYDCPVHRGSRMTWRALYEEYECHKNVQGVLFINRH